MTQQLATASEAQSTLSGVISQSIREINQVAAETATGSNQLAAESRNLSELTDKLRSMIAACKV